TTSWTGAVSPSTRRGRNLKAEAAASAAAAAHTVVVQNPAGNVEHAGAAACPGISDSMSTEHVYGPMKRASKPSRPSEVRGVPDSGRIVKLFVGQGHGIIRVATGREVYFHRSDLREGTSINDFGVGDQVVFERLDDEISGARAIAVSKQRPRGR